MINKNIDNKEPEKWVRLEIPKELYDTLGALLPYEVVQAIQDNNPKEIVPLKVQEVLSLIPDAVLISLMENIDDDKKEILKRFLNVQKEPIQTYQQAIRWIKEHNGHTTNIPVNHDYGYPKHMAKIILYSKLVDIIYALNNSTIKNAGSLDYNINIEILMLPTGKLAAKNTSGQRVLPSELSLTKEAAELFLKSNQFCDIYKKWLIQ